MQKKSLTLKDFDSKVLVSYLKEDDRLQSAIDYRCEGGPKAILEVVKGERLGVVVALGAGVFGWSLCNKKEQLVSVLDGVFVSEGQIIVEGYEDEMIYIYNSVGQCISITWNNTTSVLRIRVPYSGVYLVKIANKVLKVII